MATAAPTSTPTPAASGEELKTQEEVIGKYQSLRQEQQALMSRITQIEGEAHEHNLVLEALKPLEETRKCHRQIGGVLVEKTVGEVRPEITDSLNHFNQLLHNLNNTLNQKSAELEALVVKYKIRPMTERERQTTNENAARGGVLA